MASGPRWKDPEFEAELTARVRAAITAYDLDAAGASYEEELALCVRHVIIEAVDILGEIFDLRQG